MIDFERLAAAAMFDRAHYRLNGLDLMVKIAALRACPFVPTGDHIDFFHFHYLLLTFGHSGVPGYVFSDFNSALPEMAAAFTEDWLLGGKSWPAISIEKLAVGTKVMRGGQFIDANTVIFIREDIFQSSGVEKGNILSVRDGTQLAVLEIDSDGDASRSMICGPAGIDVTRF